MGASPSFSNRTHTAVYVYIFKSLHCLLGVVGSSGNTHCSCWAIRVRVLHGYCRLALPLWLPPRWSRRCCWRCCCLRFAFLATQARRRAGGQAFRRVGRQADRQTHTHTPVPSLPLMAVPTAIYRTRLTLFAMRRRQYGRLRRGLRVQNCGLPGGRAAPGPHRSQPTAAGSPLHRRC